VPGDVDRAGCRQVDRDLGDSYAATGPLGAAAGVRPEGPRETEISRPDSRRNTASISPSIGRAAVGSLPRLSQTLGLAASILVPKMISVLVPPPAETAATCVSDCTKKPLGTSCSSTAPSNCFCTCDGAKTCVKNC
jgi:hypothetical protein